MIDTHAKTMNYSIKIEQINNNSLQFLINWCISGYKEGKEGFIKLFYMLLDEKLKRNEIY